MSRVGASGGGKSYERRRPSSFYGVLALIVVLGLLLTVYSRYEYQNPVTTTTTPSVAPAIGTTWYAALSLEACGTSLGNLSPDPTFKGGFHVQAPNVIKVSPVSAADAGNNATLKQFAAEFPGLVATSTTFAVPTATGALDRATTFHNGQSCPSTSKYPGKKGAVEYAYWTSFAQKKPTVTTNPASIKFAQYLRVAMAFEPAGVTPTAPSQKTVNAMVAAAQTTSSPSTSVPTSSLPTTTTSSPSPSTTTTSKG